MITLKFFKYSLPFEQRQFEYFVRKGLDLSSYVSISSNLTTALDGTISRYAIDLIGYTTDVEFEPTTKFVLDIYEDSRLVRSIDMVLQDDVVEKPIMSDNNYYIHHLSLADPAILAQQRTCDNFAITYKLKDVNLSSSSTVDTNITIEEKGNYSALNIDNSASELCQDTYDSYLSSAVFGSSNRTQGQLIARRLLVAYRFKWKQPTFTFDSDNNPSVSYSDNIALKTLKANYVNKSSLTFDVPMIELSVGQNGGTTYSKIGYLPVDVKISRYNNTNNTTEYFDSEDGSTWSSDEIWNVAAPSSILGDNDFVSLFNQGGLGVDTIYWDGDSSSNNAIRQYSNTPKYIDAFNSTNIIAKQVIESSYETDYIDTRTNLPMNRRITIPTDAGYTYSIEIRLHKLVSSLQYFYKIISITTPNATSIYTYTGSVDVNQHLSLSASNINFYSQSSSSNILTKSANTTNCYYLFKKAVFSTYFAKYTDTTPMDMQTPIDVDSDTRYLLENTPIIENMYQQKNLWEIITEIGNYIHAKPYMVFDTDALDDDLVDSGRCLVKFIKYGNMEQSNTLGTRNTIFNSKFVEEYISSLDCYVDNLMQLGSTITEAIVPSSESEDYLVYNDNAILKTKYPILEITKLEVLRGSSDEYNEDTSWKDITNYVYEYNVWKCLGIDTSVVPNRSIAIYYHLGEKKVEGMQYLIPSLHSTQQYPIKKIIGEVYSMSTTDMVNVNVNEYAFRITYRTKDSVRTRVVRPDIRKYIQNNTFDYMPIHTQFRNQTDKIVDSEKYGDNVYGELIRTGNRVVEENRWTDTINDINSIGDLVKLDDDNLYYVSKVETMVYPDHYESNIEYTKDFNRLAQIIGIPSEPRFYEISEQSMIRREVNINQPVAFASELDNIDLTTKNNIYSNSTLRTYTILASLLFNAEDKRFNRVEIEYKGVYKDYDTDSNDFSKSVYVDTLWSVQNTTFTLEFDMEDNFMVGNNYGDAGLTYPNGFWSFIDYCYTGDATQQAYKTLEPVRYTDVYGRADTCCIWLGWNTATSGIGWLYGSTEYVVNKIANANDGGIFRYPGFSVFAAPKTRYMVLLKDNREALSFNLNFSFITDSDRNIVSSQIWKLGNHYDDVKLVLFKSQELSKQKSTIDKLDYIEVNSTLHSLINRDNDADYLYYNISSALSSFSDEELDEIESMAFCYDNGTTQPFTYFFGRNVKGLSQAEKRKNWYMAMAMVKQE